MRVEGEVSVRPVRGRSGVHDWLSVPPLVFRDDPAWIHPLKLVERERIDKRRNPFFKFGEAEFFVAYRGAVPVGRISAQINHRHLQQHDDATGHFGFFDCIDDREAAESLVTAAQTWLRGQGLKRMLGPCSLSINEDIGLLVSGFKTRPAIMSSHARPFTGPLLESCGMKKAMDLYAYRMSPRDMSEKQERLCRLAKAAGPGVHIRPLDLSNFKQEARIIFDIFNDGWRDNWGYVPFDEAEVAKLAREMKPIMQSKFGSIVEINGRAVAMLVGLPDLNSSVTTFDGKLLPFNWAKLLYALKRDRWKSARIPLMGIRREYRNNAPVATGLLSLMLGQMLEMIRRDYDLDWLEFSWILENNGPMVKLAEFVAGPPKRVYRVYESAI